MAEIDRDLKYFQDKLFDSLKIPKSYLGYEPEEKVMARAFVLPSIPADYIEIEIEVEEIKAEEEEPKKNFKVTNRWNNLFDGNNDLIEINHEFYVTLASGEESESIESNYSGGHYEGFYTIEEFAGFADQYKQVLIDCDVIKCTCGGDSIRATHSDWCNKYY